MDDNVGTCLLATPNVNATDNPIRCHPPRTICSPSYASTVISYGLLGINNVRLRLNKECYGRQ